MNGAVSADIPRDLRDVLADLGYIAGLQTSCKYNIKTKNYVASDSWVGAYYRGRDDESKTKSVDYINNTLDRAIEVGRQYPAWREFLTEHVTKISNALTNMEHTYTYRYPGIKSEIDIIRLRIDAKAFMMACQQKPAQRINPLANPHHYQPSPEMVSSSDPRYLNSPPAGPSPVFGSSPPAGSSPPVFGSSPPAGSSPSNNMFVWGSSPPKFELPVQTSSRSAPVPSAPVPSAPVAIRPSSSTPANRSPLASSNGLANPETSTKKYRRRTRRRSDSLNGPREDDEPGSELETASEVGTFHEEETETIYPISSNVGPKDGLEIKDNPIVASTSGSQEEE